ncbi:phosphatidylglycerophosphatase A family protein [Aquicella lusitana]|uniref:Phosphatidylglycerophosphatase A n=1 Tax=Aquicella lusitana TaxID=254246 RepID=A0A370GN68_9COXI|nr:phosphatidylglycerophosphatase A [Aquicella lusitana]RDI45175.1 phosphatidylglycerophosphatase A [Aquicella lusitana]VVC72755.1 Phosphatidylglycerophosphatase A [Aquicella lusitana]
MVQSWVTNIFNRLSSRKKPSPPVPAAVWQNPLYFIAFGLGSGAVPFAPGTFGTLMAIPFYLLLRPLPLGIYLLVVLAFVILSSLLCEHISRNIHLHDHPGMCIDEFAGFFVAMINAPHGFSWILLGFLLFRLFDIWKPWPIYFLDKNVHGGFGMVLDDVVAGLYAMIVIQLIGVIT